ncbi:MAG: hypothetical protein HN368_01250 [Spirochaetales bacterium]|nr:hypothetical protein [Spirochaetales bacterium]
MSRHPDYDKYVSSEVYLEKGSRFTRTIIHAGGRELTSLQRRDPEVHTTWALEHLLKDTDDLDAYLTIPDEIFEAAYSVENMVSDENQLNDRGIVMAGSADPLCVAAEMFSMEEYTIIALTEQERFHALLQKVAKPLYARAEFLSREFPGHLWRVVGPEFATEPYLPPYLFREYVNTYTGPIVDTIHRYGGFARLHCHGRITSALPAMMDMGIDAIDPIEPPGQGDIELSEVVELYGDRLSLFGNVEVSDIENLDAVSFERKVRESVEAGRKARGFVLMPTAAPYGREVSDLAMKNYETMVRAVSA